MNPQLINLKPYVQKLQYCCAIDCMLSCDRYILLCKHHVHSPFVCPQINADRGAGPAAVRKNTHKKIWPNNGHRRLMVIRYNAKDTVSRTKTTMFNRAVYYVLLDIDTES